MITTPPITLEWLNDKENRFAAYNISADALALINRSEIIKSDIRAYATSDHVKNGIVSSEVGVGQYHAYVAESGSTSKVVGYLDIAADRFSTPGKHRPNPRPRTRPLPGGRARRRNRQCTRQRLARA